MKVYKKNSGFEDFVITDEVLGRYITIWDSHNYRSIFLEREDGWSCDLEKVDSKLERQILSELERKEREDEWSCDLFDSNFERQILSEFEEKVFVETKNGYVMYESNHFWFYRSSHAPTWELYSVEIK